uniref:Uncharacterized protein n=1 Tax=viral metagenome TaxID=1070528 RepID=A0A6C0DZV2_9ZZZZ
MNFSEENNKKIIEHLRNIADLIENNEIDEKTLQSAGEFYMKQLFIDEIEKTDCTIEEKDMLKFLILGWYIYNFIITK